MRRGGHIPDCARVPSTSLQVPYALTSAQVVKSDALAGPIFARNPLKILKIFEKIEFSQVVISDALAALQCLRVDTSPARPHNGLMTPRTEPISLDERRAARRAALPNALTADQLRKHAVGRMRYALMQLVEDNQDRVQEWLDLIALVDGPKEALDAYIKLLEFAVPKLTRAEVSVEDGGKTKTAELTMSELQEIIREARTIEGTATHVDEPDSGDNSIE